MTQPSTQVARGDLVARYLEIVRAHTPDEFFRKVVGSADITNGETVGEVLWAMNKLLYDPRVRRAVAAAMAAEERAILGSNDDLRASVPVDVLAADQVALQSEGLLQFGQLLTSSEAEAARRYLQSCGEPQSDTTLLDYDIADVIRAPYLVQCALNPRILAAASAHLGMPAAIVDISAWISLPGGAKPEGPQVFHRDRDDFRACKLFVYLTDVGPEDGPHMFIRQTHDFEWILAQAGGEASMELALSLFTSHGRHIAQQVEQAFHKYIAEITGPAGTGFLELTYGFHRGKVPTRRPRLVFQVMYAMTPFPVRTHKLSKVKLDRLPRVADTASVRNALRFFQA